MPTNNWLDWVSNEDRDVSDANDYDHLTTVTYSRTRDAGDDTSQHPSDVIAPPEPIDLTLMSRRRELSPEIIADIRHAFPADVVKSCDTVHADLIMATRLIKDLQLGYTARILESLWGTVAASWAALGDTSVPASHSIAGEGDRSRKESTDRIARVVLSAVSSFEEEPVKSGDPTTRLLEYLNAARHIEQRIPTVPRERSHPPGHIRSHVSSLSLARYPVQS
ncbi:hypothetical protein K4K53_002820 [Colletotrichum sp. SAR 10_77]|nr:hypothetical protein K4K53_002820 [Colletotrichum sp. SAR 10_77]KAJ5000233.1 hypothetical protein K4K48_002965 [Colletotrichum sp. SAR 10_66]